MKQFGVITGAFPTAWLPMIGWGLLATVLSVVFIATCLEREPERETKQVTTSSYWDREIDDGYPPAEERVWAAEPWTAVWTTPDTTPAFTLDETVWFVADTLISWRFIKAGIYHFGEGE